MADSVQLGRVFSIPIGLHWSVVVLAAVFGFALGGTVLPAAAPGYSFALYAVTAFLLTVALMAAIVAHELGHATEAIRDGMQVQGVSLFALGGVAKLEGEPTTPKAAARIALAGPLVSLAIGVAGVATWWATSNLGAPVLITMAALWFGFANVVMAVFNMIPALPLDGGRALQAYLWGRSGDSDRATITAARVGRYLGWAIVAFGLWSLLTGGSGIWTMVMGWFVARQARAESLRARFRLRSRSGHQPFWWPYLGIDRFAGSPFTSPQSSAPPRGTTPRSSDPLGSYRRRSGDGPVVEVPSRQAA